MHFSRRSESIQPSATLSISSRAKEMKTSGIDVVNFGAGEPDFPTPDLIKKAAVDAIKNNYTGYTPASGSLELKKSVKEKLARDQGLDYSINEITIGCGAKHVLFNIMNTLLNPGDEAIICAPYWVSYPQQIRYTGARPVVVDCSENSFMPEPEKLRAAISKKTRLILINSPSNPAGVVMPPDLLKEIGEICAENNIYLISDEIYEKLIYGTTKHYSPASFSPGIKATTLVVNGVSKAYSMTGWRIGYAAGPEAIIEKINTLMSHSTSNPCSISQKAAVKALELDNESIKFMVDAFSERCSVMHKLLNAIPGVRCLKPEGAFYALPDCGELINSLSEISSDMQLAGRLLEEAHLAVVPGTPFGAPGHLRFSYANSLERIQEGLERFNHWVKKQNK